MKSSRAGARLDKLELADKTLLCDLILDTDASDVNERKFRRAMSKNITPTLCKDEKHLTIFRIGVHYEYRYRGKDGKEIATISVGSSDCE